MSRLKLNNFPPHWLKKLDFFSLLFRVCVCNSFIIIFKLVFALNVSSSRTSTTREKKGCCIFHDNEMSSQENRVVFFVFLLLYIKKRCVFRGCFPSLSFVFSPPLYLFSFTFFRDRTHRCVYFRKGKFLFDRIIFSLFAVVVWLLSLFEGDSKVAIFLFIRKRKTCLRLFNLPRISTTSEQTNKNLKPCFFVRMSCVYVSLCVRVVSPMFNSRWRTHGTKKNAIFSCTSLLLTTVSPFFPPLFFFLYLLFVFLLFICCIQA